MNVASIQQQSKHQHKANLAMITGGAAPDANANSEGLQHAAHKLPLDSEIDPVNFMGFGIVSYFSLLKTLMFIFLVLTLVHIPVLRAYTSYTNYSHDLEMSPPYSIGNLGFAEPKCVTVGMAASKVYLSCKTG